MRRLISKDEVSIIPSANLRVSSDVSRSRNRTFLKMPAFDYATQAELFDYGTEAELFTANLRKTRRQPLGYKRFASADAIRFAIEDLPPQLLLGTYLEMNELKYEGREIRRLYEGADYPLTRATDGSLR
jgi:hypothetical protein